MSERPQCQPQTAPGVCREAQQGGSIHVKPEPLLEEGYTPAEDIMCMWTYCGAASTARSMAYLLQWALCHLEACKGTVVVMFFDFFSAFNTIKPSLHRISPACRGGPAAGHMDNLLPHQYGTLYLVTKQHGMWWSTAQGLHRWPHSYYLSFRSTRRTSDTTLKSVLSRSFPMTPPLLAACKSEPNINTESFVTLKNAYCIWLFILYRCVTACGYLLVVTTGRFVE